MKNVGLRGHFLWEAYHKGWGDVVVAMNVAELARDLLPVLEHNVRCTGHTFGHQSLLPSSSVTPAMVSQEVSHWWALKSW